MAFCISFNGKGSDCPIRPSCLHGGFKAWIWARAGFIEHVTMISRICEFTIRCEFEASKVGTIKDNTYHGLLTWRLLNQYMYMHQLLAYELNNLPEGRYYSKILTAHLRWNTEKRAIWHPLAKCHESNFWTWLAATAKEFYFSQLISSKSLEQ